MEGQFEPYYKIGLNSSSPIKKLFVQLDKPNQVLLGALMKFRTSFFSHTLVVPNGDLDQGHCRTSRFKPDKTMEAVVSIDINKLT